MIRRFAALVLATASSWANDTFVHESADNLMFVSNHQVVIQTKATTPTRVNSSPNMPCAPAPCGQALFEIDLVIRKSSPQQLVSTCFKGLSKTSPTEFRAQRSPFKPSEDLRVLYLEQPK
jgi:Domain of unknown function (DUF4424)